MEENGPVVVEGRDRRQAENDSELQETFGSLDTHVQFGDALRQLHAASTRMLEEAGRLGPEINDLGRQLDVAPPSSRQAPNPYHSANVEEALHRVTGPSSSGAGSEPRDSNEIDREVTGGGSARDHGQSNNGSQRRNLNGSTQRSSNEEAEETDESSSLSTSSSSGSSSSTSSSSSSSSSSESEEEEEESESSSDEAESSSDEDTEGTPQGLREEQEAYRKLSVDKELFHVLHKIRANDPTGTSLSMLPEADRVLRSCDWDTATLLTHKKSYRPLTRRELLNHVASQLQSQRPELGVPTGAQLLQDALARPPLFLKELQIYAPLLRDRLNTEDGNVLSTFLAKSTSLREFTLFHTSNTGTRQEHASQSIPQLLNAAARSSSIRKLALRKLNLPENTSFGRLLSETSSLSELEVAYCSLQSETLQTLRDGFLENSTIQKFVLHKDLNDTDPSFVPIFEGLKNHQAIKEFVLDIMTCKQEELTSLGEVIASTPKLESFALIVASKINLPQRRQDRGSGLNANPAARPELNGSLFFESLASSNSLRRLRLHPYVTLLDENKTWSKLMQSGIVESYDLGQGLSRQTNPAVVDGTFDTLMDPGRKHKIRDLNLSNANCHGELSFSRVFQGQGGEVLTKLYLRNCRLMDSDVADLANGLLHNGNKSLKELDLGSNYVGYHGLDCLAQAIGSEESGLESLDLSFNSFGHFICVKSFSMLLKSTSLKFLDVSCTDLFAHQPPSSQPEELRAGAEGLRKALSENVSLARLAADDDGFSDALSIALFVGLRDNRFLQELSLDGNSLRLGTSECRHALVEMLSKNRTLETLNMPRNRGMTESGFRALTSGIKRSKSLKSVSVRVLNGDALPKLLSCVVNTRKLRELTVTMPSSLDRVQAESRILHLLKCVGKVKTFQSLSINGGENHLIAPTTGKILLDILKKNPSFHSFNLSLALCPFDLRVKIEFLVEVNKRGRRFLDSNLQQPVGLWPHILSPLTVGSGCYSYLYFFLREHIALHQRSS